MAKAKKTTTPDETPAAAPAPKKAPAKKAPAVAAKAKKGAPAGGSPLVDTGLAAQAAAKQLAAGLSPLGGAASSGRESTSFKHLKDSLAKPAAAGLDSLLDKTALPSSRKANTPFGGPRGAMGGRNQTFGADVNRSGVPRRTSGG